MGWFGPSKDEVWRQLSQEIGADFVDGSLPVVMTRYGSGRLLPAGC
jgi:hypothetical protein